MSKAGSLSEAQVQNAYRKALSAYGARPDVTGVDVGFKYVNGQRTKQTAIRIHVREKLPASGLEAVAVFPQAIDGVPTDVIEAIYRPQAELVTAAARTQRLDPLQPGISVAHSNVSAGTLGAIVFDQASGKPAILSNWHVLAGSAAARAGDPILQPGPADTGRLPSDVVAHLERFILSETGDAAVALLNGQRSVLNAQFGTNIQLRGARPVVGDEVLEKSGRSTGVTRGRVDGEGRYNIDYSVGRIGVDGFKIVARREGNPDDEEISAGGDSGSVWYAPGTREGVGLHFAGEVDALPASEHAIACHLPAVLQALKVSLTPVLVQTAAAAAQPRIESPIAAAPDLMAWLTANREPLLALLSALPGNGHVGASSEPMALLAADAPRVELVS